MLDSWIVELSWQGMIIGDPMYILHQKLKRLKAVLRKFNQDEFGNITTRVNKKRKELDPIQVLVLNANASLEIIEQEMALSLELHTLMQAEESYFKQKSLVSWIKEGDQNINFFQKMVVAQQNKSLMTFLIDDEGNKLTTFSQISNEAILFF